MKEVTIYTTTSCSYCVRAKALLGRKGVPYKEVDVTGDDAARERLVEISDGAKTVPQIWVGTEHVGGYTDLAELEQAGRLDALLAG